MAALTAAKTELVLIDYDDLELRDQRLRLLGIARRLGTLPEETLAKYENPDLHYCAGWSRGREKFKGKVDTAKGSWYANGLHEDAANGDADLKARYPESTTEPAWPDAEVGDDMRGAFRSVITALAPAIYFDDATGERVGAPAGAGLLAFSRSGAKVRVGAPPEGSILFQIGEAAQILSGGTLVATPHAVAAGDMARVSRESFALFVEPDWDEAMQPPHGGARRLREVPHGPIAPPPGF
ncbi:hypothetical protein JL720_10140 [Aureococcus anophagefferens]|nr:hypothetical protein JL720_10140 [Aureococcus anophagefferens]